MQSHAFFVSILAGQGTLLTYTGMQRRTPVWVLSAVDVLYVEKVGR
jgi:hypothetical protein